MKAIILAAGKGERLRPLTETIPKPMIKIMDKPVLEYLILLLKHHGVTEIGINTSYLPEKIKEYFGDGSKWGVKIRYSFEPELIGTSGALNNFKDFLTESCFLIYGDTVTDLDLTKFMQYHKEKGGIATTALRKKPVTMKPASLVFLNKDNKVEKLVERPSEEVFHELCKEYYFSNSGIYVLEPKILDYIPEGFSDFMKNVFPSSMEKGESIFGFVMDKNSYSVYREVGKIEKYELAKNELESGKAKLSFLNEEKKDNHSNRAIFLDRDGVINTHLYETDGKIMSPANLEQLKLMDHVKEGISEMRKLGFKIIVITNQPGVAFGYINPEKLKEIHNYLKKELGIDEIYTCPHHPRFTGPCNCKKPKTGLIDQAVKDFNINLQQSYMVGDSLSDIQTGKNAGVKKTILVGIDRLDVRNIMHQKNIFPDIILPNLVEIAHKIKELESN